MTTKLHKLYTIHGETYTLEMSKYISNGNTSAILYSTDDPLTYRKVSTNIKEKLPTNQVAIKTWSENESWINEFLVQTAWIFTNQITHSGFVQIPIYEIPSTKTN